MAKTKEYKITVQQGQALLGLALNFRMPDKLGSKAFTSIERAAAERDVLALYDSIKRISPMLRKTGKEQGQMFGPEEMWEIKKDAEGKPIAGSATNEQAEVALALSDKAVSGALWCLLFALHPDSPAPHAGPMLASDVLYPLAFRLRRLMALEDELGLRNAPSKVWEEDEEAEPAEEKKETERIEKREPASA